MSDLLLFAINSLNDAQLSVVPVVAQAGTALAPLIAVGVTNTIGLLLKPRELIRVLRAKPWILLVLVLIGAAGWGLWSWWTAPPATAARGTAAPTGAVSASTTDWSAVALEIIRQRSAGPPPAPVTTPAVEPAKPSTSAAAVYYRGGPGRSGHLGGAVPRGLTQAWSYRPQDDQFAMILSSPIVHNGAIYGASCLIDPPSSFGTIFCLDATTGAQRWLTSVQDPAKKTEFTGFFSSPAISSDGTTLVIGQGLHMDYDAHLICLDTATGAVRWTVATPLHLESSPAIEGDVVVIGAGAIEQGEHHKPVGDPQGHGHPGFVLGVRISTGQVIFREPVNDPESSPVLQDGICYIGSGVNGNRVVAIRATLSDDELKAKGQQRRLWDVATPFPATGAVTLAGDSVLIGCGAGDFVFAAANPEGRVIAFDPATGAERWSVKMPDAVLGSIATQGSTAVVPCRNGEVIALDLAAKGKELWRARVNRLAPVLAGPAIADGRVFAISNDGWMAVLDLADGKQLERIYLNDPARPGEMGLSTSAPIILDGRLYVGSETGGLRCYTGGK